MIRDLAFAACLAVAALLFGVGAASGWGTEPSLECTQADGKRSASELRFNQIQTIGTHNSYHIAPPESLGKMLDRFKPQLSRSLDYTHPPLEVQFREYGMRHIELDLLSDPNGGKYARPTTAERFPDVFPVDDPAGLMKQPGFKVLHLPNHDFLTNVLTFKQALQQVRGWLSSHPQSCPIVILLELKQTSSVIRRKISVEQLNAVDEEILSVFDRTQIITPDAVRGDAKTLRDAVVTSGWPPLDRVRGKVMFLLDNSEEDAIQTYLAGHESLRGRLIFVNVPTEDPAAAFVKLNDPVVDFDKIQSLVRQGFLVRTRADAGTKEARTNHVERRDRAIASGAQLISTDYPVPDRRWSDYHVRLPGNLIARPNPVAAPKVEPVELDTPVVDVE